MKNWEGLILLLLLGIPPLVCPVRAAAGEDQRAESSPAEPAKGTTADQSPAVVAESQDPRAEDESRKSLGAVGDYQVLTGDFEKIQRRNPPVELFNPFQARKSRPVRGSVYLFHRNDYLDARNFFDPVGEALPEFKRNQFGLNLGTLVFGRLNLFGSYDGFRIIQGSTIVSHVPTPEMKSGDFSSLEVGLVDPWNGSSLPGNLIPRERFHPVSLRTLDLFPDPNAADPDRNFVNSQPEVSDQDSVAVRGDLALDNDTNIYASYSIWDRRAFRVVPLPHFGIFDTARAQEARLSLNQRLSYRFSGEVFTRFERRSDKEVSQNSGNSGLLGSLGIAGVSVDDPSEEGYPDFQVLGYSDPGDDPSSPESSVSNWYVLGGNFNYVLEKHSLNFGANLRSHQINDDRTGAMKRGSFYFSGNFTGDAFADFLLGLPYTATRGVGTNRSDARARRWEFHLSDSWRLHPNLQWTGGILYNFFQPYRAVSGNVSTFYPLEFEPPETGEIIVGGSERAEELGFAGVGSLVRPDRNDWAPRVGLAYNPFGNNRLVFRSSFSIYYAPPDGQDFIRRMTRNYPFFELQTARSTPDHPGIDLSDPFANLAPVELNMSGIDPNLRTGYVQYWRLTGETRLGSDWNISASYQGGKGTGLLRLLTANVPTPGPGPIQERRPNPDFGVFSILEGASSYTEHALVWELEKRLTDGFSVESDFRWTRHLDDLAWGGAANPRDYRSEKALAGWIPVKRFDLRYIFDLPFGDPYGHAGWLSKAVAGWRLSGVTRIQDGLPFSVSLPNDPNNDGVFYDRPDRLGSGLTSSPSIDGWFATEDFTAPDTYGFGDSGRNILFSPGYQNWDISLSKRTSVADGHFLEFRLEMFNAFNHPNFSRPNASYGTSLFGKVYGASRAREIEVALKYSF